ncbi:hypothetical protein ACFFX0_22545 [Citricoccus parietis]|uniref:Uncharacterized protein n=1 Tax=Citricoccus parietis TaxID=592307 RepID=A0ABV5G5V3_9MICC
MFWPARRFARNGWIRPGSCDLIWMTSPAPAWSRGTRWPWTTMRRIRSPLRPVSERSRATSFQFSSRSFSAFRSTSAWASNGAWMRRAAL